MTGTLELGVEPEHRHATRAREEPREREDVTVGEVDQLQDPADQRIAERDDAVDGAVVRPTSPTLMYSTGTRTKFTSEPDDQSADEREPDLVDVRRGSKPGERRHAIEARL